MEEPRTMALWTAELEGSVLRKVSDQVEGDLINNEIMETSVPREEPIVSPHEDYVTCSEVEKLMEDNIKTVLEAATRRVATGIVDKTIENAFAECYDVE